MIQQIDQLIKLQNNLNKYIDGENWKDKKRPYLRACWIECGELAEFCNFKWWKKPQDINNEQAQIELVDCVHFILSYLYAAHKEKSIDIFLEGYNQSKFQESTNILEAIDKLSLECLLIINNNYLANSTNLIKEFFVACKSLNLSFDELYLIYIAKNVLNIFRQDHGYKEGTYIKQWPSPLDHGTVEDNVYLEMIMNEDSTKLLVSQEPDKLFDFVYNRLEQNYPSI